MPPQLIRSSFEAWDPGSLETRSRCAPIRPSLITNRRDSKGGRKTFRLAFLILNLKLRQRSCQQRIVQLPDMLQVPS